jgi:hypothetical protein
MTLPLKSARRSEVEGEALVVSSKVERFVVMLKSPIKSKGQTVITTFFIAQAAVLVGEDAAKSISN